VPTRRERELIEKFNALDDVGRESLMDFLDFLHAKRPREDEQPHTEPLDLARPTSESVVSAMRRLRRSYPMLDVDTLFHRASALMSEHVLRGRPAESVIDDLEELFRNHYQSRRDGLDEEKGE
jgi:hypothetical protein